MAQKQLTAHGMNPKSERKPCGKMPRKKSTLQALKRTNALSTVRLL